MEIKHLDKAISVLESLLKAKNEQLNLLKQQLLKSETIEQKNLELKLANCFKEKDEQIIAIKKIYVIQMKISKADLLRHKSSYEKITASLNAQIKDINTNQY